MIVTVTLNPCVDRTLFVAGLRVHDTNRVTQTEIDAGGKGLNLSRVATRLGAKTVALGFLGGEAITCACAWRRKACRSAAPTLPRPPAPM
jgi:fructose-1-phosphate kinase PfkB-like protein